MKKPHYRGTYHVQSRRVRDAANANPSTLCWRCGNTLDQHEPDRQGRPPRWTAGHIIDGQRDGQLAPEANTCNYQAGGRLGRQRQQQEQRTPLTW